VDLYSAVTLQNL